MHELSHIVLKHNAGKVFVSPAGQMLLSEYDKVQKEEADCLSGTLLVPRAVLLGLLGNVQDENAWPRILESLVTSCVCASILQG